MESTTGVIVKIFEYSVADFQILWVAEILLLASQSSQFYEIVIASARFLAFCTAWVSVHF